MRLRSMQGPGDASPFIDLTIYNIYNDSESRLGIYAKIYR
jgi:hypothetical protein